MKPATISGSVQSIHSDLVAGGKLGFDPAQQTLSRRLDRLVTELGERRLSRKSSALGWFFGKGQARRSPRGMYIHGKVGRGKSMMMDIFFDLAPVKRRRRSHFNEFMADVHDRIHRQRSAYAGGRSRAADPIRPVGVELAGEARLLCLDEFAVTDIADAMILARLFAVLFEKGVVVVATSNVAPDALYRDGLNRPLFEPFVDLLKKHCEVFELNGADDYRLDGIARGQAFLSPLNDGARTTMAALWERATGGATQTSHTFHIKGRKFVAGRTAGGAAWFTFGELCGEPHAARDYLEIVKRFDTVFIENVPMMDYSMRNEAKRFIQLVDILYDARVRAVISAQTNPHALYSAAAGAEAFEFQRTASRLIEMQSAAYQADFMARKTSRQAS